MSKRTGSIALAAAAIMMMIGSTASAGAREIVRYNSEVQPGTIVVKTAERRLYLVLGEGSAIRYLYGGGRPPWQAVARQGSGERQVRPARLDASGGSQGG